LRGREYRKKHEAGNEVQLEWRDVLLNASFEIVAGQSPGFEHQWQKRARQTPIDAELLVDKVGNQFAHRHPAFHLMLPTLRAVLAWIRVVTVRAERGSRH
jgi:hypothetical protein